MIKTHGILLVGFLCVSNALYSAQRSETKWRPFEFIFGDPNQKDAVSLNVSTNGVHVVAKDAKGNNNIIRLTRRNGQALPPLKSCNELPHEIKDLVHGYTVGRCLISDDDEYCIAELMLPNGSLAQIVSYTRNNVQEDEDLFTSFTGFSLHE